MKLSRRALLARSSGLSLGMAGARMMPGMFAATAGTGLAAHGHAADFTDYKAMVCILLAGGNDSYNMLVPDDADQYAAYRALRSDLALAREDLLPLDGVDTLGRSYGVHPGMPEVQSLYNSGDLAFVSNVGPLVEPASAAQVRAGTVRVPLGLYSHSDQIAQWQTALPEQRAANGWGGRLAELLADSNTGPLPFSLSLSGTNLFQSGATVSAYAVDSGEGGITGLSGYGAVDEFGQFRTPLIDRLLGGNRSHRLREEYRQRFRSALDRREFLVDALDGVTDSVSSASTFSDSPFSAALAQISRLIAARESLGACRQTFFVLYGGWDHHDDVLDNQAAMLPVVSAGLQEFRDALQGQGLLDQVTTFTISDFGRTMTSNGKGSDHGWGGHALAMGGALQGGQIFGTYPELSLNSPLDVGRGVFVPTLSIDEYFADLALWFGVSPGELELVLPNVRRFYSPESVNPPLGLLMG